MDTQRAAEIALESSSEIVRRLPGMMEASVPFTQLAAKLHEDSLRAALESAYRFGYMDGSSAALEVIAGAPRS